MTNSIKFDHGEVKMIAHRGLSGIERENSCPAFIAAATHSYYGIETDIHVTADGKYLVSHDSNLLRCTGVDMVIEETDFDTLRSVPLLDTDGKTLRTDLYPPTLEDYLSICRKYGKQAVLEIKNQFEEKHIDGVLETISQFDWYERTTLISFNEENLIIARRLCPDIDIQFLGNATDELLAECKKYHFGADVNYKSLNADFVSKIHAADLKVNTWTVDKIEDAQRVIEMGVDQITSNILE